MDVEWHQAWRKIAGWAVGLLVVSLVMAGCGGSSAGASPTSTATTAPTATATSVATATPNSNQTAVRILGSYVGGQFSFSPASITIPVGTTVVWTNSSAVAHTTTSDAGSAVTWDSGLIDPGATFSFTFTKAGTFTYHCNVHPYMHGTVVVTA